MKTYTGQENKDFCQKKGFRRVQIKTNPKFRSEYAVSG